MGMWWCIPLGCWCCWGTTALEAIVEFRSWTLLPKTPPMLENSDERNTWRRPLSVWSPPSAFVFATFQGVFGQSHYWGSLTLSHPFSEKSFLCNSRILRVCILDLCGIFIRKRGCSSCGWSWRTDASLQRSNSNQILTVWWMSNRTARIPSLFAGSMPLPFGIL